ncbi:hypothetical protein FHR84_002021 [Actinopolyspora biskrensis]|uniref:Uncharacterized protein n=1 Tax=Actinopolyspora biskrensis TaxID=1470178 RepID=A0A852Z546_9ACTN|nr:hypothetical protein [Actinopolyspora biskrensis]NYH78696.1 hypothetical protein [Actinopolyspora biskrensis]
MNAGWNSGPAQGEPVRGESGSGPDSPPRSVWLARWLWIAAAIVGFARSVIQMSDRRALVEELRSLNPELAQHEVDAAVNGGIMFSLLLVLAVAALYVLIGNKMARGRNWARVVILVIAGLLVVSTAFTLITTGSGTPTASVEGVPSMALGPLSLAFGIVIALLDAAVFVLLLRPESRRFFAEVKRRGPR